MTTRRLALPLLLLAMMAMCAHGQRRKATPVTTPAAQTQPLNERAGDSARIRQMQRARLKQVTDADGNIMLIDTVTGTHYIDTAAMQKTDTRMQYPLWHAVAAGVDIWDAVMRATGQDWGLFGLWAQVNMHNRYLPTLEIGLGQCSHHSQRPEYSYRSGLAPYFKIGADYNFLYNSNPDYMLLAGVRYGLSPFSYEVTDAVADNGYWDQQVHLSVPSQTCVAQYFEVSLGVRVRLWKGLSAGWAIRYHRLLSESGGEYGRAWYIPGYGSRGPQWGGSFSLSYTLPLHKAVEQLPAGADTTAITMANVK